MQIVKSNVFDFNWQSNKRIVINRGGTRAGKTYALMQIFAVWLLTGYIRQDQFIGNGVASVVRKTLPSLKATAQKDFEEIIDGLGVRHLIKENKTDRYYQITDKHGTRTLEFFSVDDQQKVRGRKRQILFCNEANELNYDTDFFQLNIRTTDLIFIDFNPSDPYIWIKERLEDERAIEMGDVQTIISTYKDNPFLPESLIREIEAIKDETYRKVYVHGEYGVVKGTIFPDVTIVSEMPKHLKKKAIGLDFGFTNDPTAAILCGIHEGALYLDELIYDYAMTNQDIAKELKQFKCEVICDSAEPKSIEELKRTGLRAKAAKKGADSIRAGIGILKQYELRITSRSTNLLREQKQYKYKEKDGKSLNEPIDSFNHAWDAIRYYALLKLTRPNNNILAFS
jgi:phage terminase large subunit